MESYGEFIEVEADLERVAEEENDNNEDQYLGDSDFPALAKINC